MCEVNALAVQVLQDAAALEGYREDWNRLVASSRAKSLFLTWEWVRTWWNVYGAGYGLFILAARDSLGQLVGLAPFKISSRAVLGLHSYNVLEFVGQGGDVTPEYLDLIEDPQHEGAVRMAFGETLTRDRRWDSIDLHPIDHGSPNLAALESRLRQVGTTRLRSQSVCPIMELPESIDAFLAGRSPNYRKKMREYERRCQRDGIQLRRSKSPDELSRDMVALMDLHRLRWRDASSAFRSPEYCRFHHELAHTLFDIGVTRMFSLTCGERPVAVSYCFAYGDRYYFYQSGWDPAFARYRVGLVLMHKVIQEAILERARIFDFLRGEEGYKYRWATSRVVSARFRCWRSPVLRSAVGAQEFVQRIIDRGRRSAWRLVPRP